MIGTVQEERYRVIRKLGEGGMGEVYLVEHLHLGRQEALKVLHLAIAADPYFVGRFRREARATNRVQHANIVGVYDFGRLADGRFFLALEFVDGQRLDAVLKQGPMRPGRALRLCTQLAEAVSAAHQLGVIHRDLKPANIVLVDHRGHPDTLKVLDFGMAKMISPDGADGFETRRGEIMGTPAYMAPDQLIGGSADPRADLYSLGCIAYELLAGQPPFTGRTSEIVEAHMSKAPERPSARLPRAGIPAAFEDIIIRCLAKRPSERYPSARDLLADLKALAPQEPRRTAKTMTAVSFPCLPSRASASGVPRGAASRALPASSSDFDVPDTAERDAYPTPPWSAAEDLPSGAEITDRLGGEHARSILRATVKQLAESIIDLGPGHARMIVGLASVKKLEGDLLRLESEASELEAEADRIEQWQREREAPLTFAVGDLSFERRASAVDDPDLARVIHELEAQVQAVAREAEQALALNTERAITLASIRHDSEVALDAAYAALEALLDETTAEERAHPACETLSRRLKSVRDMVRRAMDLGR